MRALQALALTALFASVVAGGGALFGGCRSDDFPTPAWPDARPPRRISVDALPPVTRDESEDVDPGYDPFVGKWKYLPGEPINCKIRIAEDPAASITPLVFEPCKLRAGCRRLVVDWWKQSWGALRFPEVEPVRLVSGIPYIDFWKEYPTEVYAHTSIASISVVAPLDGSPVFAAGIFTPSGKDWCPFSTTHGDEGVALHALPRPARTWDLFGWSAWSAPTMLETHTMSHAEIPCDHCQLVVTSGPSLGCSCHGGGLVFDKAHKTVISPRPSLAGNILAPPVKDGFLNLGWGTRPYSFDVLRRDGTHAKLLWPTANHALFIGVDRSASEAFAWIEAAGDDLPPFANAVLWTAPYASSEASLVRRKVALLGTITSRSAMFLVVNRGAALFAVSDKTARLVRLSDGYGWAIDMESEDRLDRALWVDDDEVWLSVSAAASNDRVWSIVRITRASLGPPNTAPGF